VRLDDDGSDAAPTLHETGELEMPGASRSMLRV
jgi:hypothetical protein